MVARRCLVAVLGLICLPWFAVPLLAANKPDIIIVSGASGQVGELTVKELLRRGVKPQNLILVSRTPEKLADYAKMGASVRVGDLFKPETLASAYAGGTRMLLISVGGGPTPRPLAHKAAFDAAVKAGVRHIVYTSFLGADKGTTPIITDHLQTENYLKASGAKWTALRDGYYADIHVQAAVDMAKTGRATVRPEDWKSAAVTRADCAAAAAGALLNPSLSENQTFDITGPELYGRRDVAKAVGDLIGKNIEVVELAPGASPGPISLGPPATTPQVVSDAVTKLAGRAPMGLKALLEANKEQILAAAKGP